MSWILKYDKHYSRRQFLSKSANGIFSAGVLCSAWDLFAKTGDTASAYPEELRSIEQYTRGKLKPGDLINKDNVEFVKDLLDDVRLRQIREMGRIFKLAPTTNELHKLNPVEYLEASLRNEGFAIFDQNGNVVTKDGRPWIGGNPFPKPKSAMEVFSAHTLSWGRHDASLYVSKEYDLDSLGNLQYEYTSGWAEMSAIGRITMDPKPYMFGMEDKLRFQSIFFVSPNDLKGTSYLNIWPYDQRQFPELYGYIPAFRRTRRFPTNQRFEPLNPGSELYLSDAWAAGDPFLTWGDYQIVGRGPVLAAVSNGWNAENPNWEHSTHGGKNNNLFWDTVVELVPEAIVVEAKPLSYSRSPVSKKRVWFDARTLTPLSMISYDRRGEMFRYFDGSYGVYEQGSKRVMDRGNPYWSWTALHAFNIQTSRLTRIEQVKEIQGGHHMRVNDSSIYDKYLTINALQQFA